MEKITRKNVDGYVDQLLDQKKYTEALDLIGRFRVKGYTITQTSMRKIVSQKFQDGLVYREIKNPIYATAAPMKLYLLRQIYDLKK